MSRDDLRAFHYIEGTKISHNMMGDKVESYSYRELVDRKAPCIGIPAKLNRLLIVDVDIPGATHHHDGRVPWQKFCEQHEIPETYTVTTPGGGTHYYFSLPLSIDLDIFNPRKELYPGVDIVYKGWVAAPPSEGYTIVRGGLKSIADIPDALLEAVQVRDQKGDPILGGSELPAMYLHKAFSETQLKHLKNGLVWVSKNVSLTYHQWRDGIYSLKAGIEDPVVMEEYITVWTKNLAYQEGDVEQAFSLAHNSTAYGPIGPGTILKLIRDLAFSTGAVQFVGDKSKKDILEATGIHFGVNKSGVFTFEKSELNMALIIEQIYDPEDLYYDSREQRVVFREEEVSVEEMISTMLITFQDRDKGLGLPGIKRVMVADGLELVLHRRRVDREKNRLNSIPWDHEARVDDFFVMQFGLERNRYHQCIGRNFWLAMSARIMNPGIKFDNMIIFRGAEGVGKSSLLEAIGGRYYYSMLDSRGLYMEDGIRKMHQSVLVELPELLGFHNRNPEKIKATLSTQTDKVREPYARHAVDRGRGFIVVGTTNEVRYLDPRMGVRRFWPINIERKDFCVNLKYVHRHRDQLFAEAIYRYKQGETFYSVEGEYAGAKQAVRVDPMYGLIKIFCADKTEIRVAEIYQHLIMSDYLRAGLTPEVGERIENCLGQLGGVVQSVDDGSWRLPPPAKIGDFL